MVTFISGGARSGKSRYAERLADRYNEVTYIATALAIDPEMKERIAIHQSRRPPHWRTVEAHTGLGVLVEGMCGAVILDCLTVMMTNLMMEAPLQKNMNDFDWDALSPSQVGQLERYVMDEMLALRDGIQKTAADMILVSNELGMGLVPPYPLGRAFRDIAGRVNAMFAELADKAVLMVSGLPLRLK